MLCSSLVKNMLSIMTYDTTQKSSGMPMTPVSPVAPCGGSLHWLQGLLPEKKIFEVHIEKGHKHNAKVVLRGEAGYSEPGIQPGDVIFVLEQKPHKTFKRIQADLVIEKASTPYQLSYCHRGLKLCLWRFSSHMGMHFEVALRSRFLAVEYHSNRPSRSAALADCLLTISAQI